MCSWSITLRKCLPIIRFRPSRIVPQAATHEWQVDEAEARQLQLRLALHVVSSDDFTRVRLIGGVSIRPIGATIVHAGVCVLDLPTLKVMDSATARATSNFQYVSGLRAFQAGPVIGAAFEKLRARPDLVLWDGHG